MGKISKTGSNEYGQVPVVDGFNIPPYDSSEITYVATGNGVGEIETVVYKNGGSVVATLTMAYNGDNKLSSITKS